MFFFFKLIICTNHLNIFKTKIFVFQKWNDCMFSMFTNSFICYVCIYSSSVARFENLIKCFFILYWFAVIALCTASIFCLISVKFYYLIFYAIFSLVINLLNSLLNFAYNFLFLHKLINFTLRTKLLVIIQ